MKIVVDIPMANPPSCFAIGKTISAIGVNRFQQKYGQQVIASLATFYVINKVLVIVTQAGGSRLYNVVASLYIALTLTCKIDALHASKKTVAGSL